jgi:thioredoxin-like negative regulator of GroEL
VDTAPGVSARFTIRGIPTLIVFRDGEEVDRLSGAPPKADLEAWVEQQLGAVSADGP